MPAGPLRAAARTMFRMADASAFFADNMERAARAASAIPGMGFGDARGSGSGAGGGGSSAGADGGARGSGSGGGGGGGSTGALANRDALRWLERLWYAQMEANFIADKRFPGGTIRRMSR